jgi:predicted Zn-dependent peptidase
MMDYLMQGIYAHSGYGNWILGTEPFISTVRMELLKQRYEEIYVADNCALVVVTSLDVREIVATIQALFGGVPSGIPTPIEVPISEQVHLKVLRQKSEQVILYMGGIGPSTRDEGAKNFEVAVTAWGTIPNSRLFLSAREREGLVYQIQSFYTGHVQTGLWGVLTSVSKKKFPELMKVLHEELDRLHAEPLTEMEIMRGVSVLKTNLFTKLQQPDYYLRVLGRREAFRETIYPNDLVRQYELALPERIQTWVQDYVRPLDLSYVVMGDVGADDVLQAINR